MIFLQIETIDDYNEYCYYAAGLFSEGVTNLIHLGGLEVHISVSSTIPMALTLQVLLS